MTKNVRSRAMLRCMCKQKRCAQNASSVRGHECTSLVRTQPARHLDTRRTNGILPTTSTRKTCKHACSRILRKKMVIAVSENNKLQENIRIPAHSRGEAEEKTG